MVILNPTKLAKEVNYQKPQIRNNPKVHPQTIAKQTVVYPYQRILFSNENERNKTHEFQTIMLNHTLHSFILKNLPEEVKNQTHQLVDVRNQRRTKCGMRDRALWWGDGRCHRLVFSGSCVCVPRVKTVH